MFVLALHCPLSLAVDFEVKTFDYLLGKFWNSFGSDGHIGHWPDDRQRPELETKLELCHPERQVVKVLFRPKSQNAVWSFKSF